MDGAAMAPSFFVFELRFCTSLAEVARVFVKLSLSSKARHPP